MRHLLAAHATHGAGHGAVGLLAALRGGGFVRQPAACGIAWRRLGAPFLPSRGGERREGRHGVLARAAASPAASAAEPAAVQPLPLSPRHPPAAIVEVASLSAQALSNRTGLQVLFLGTGCGPPTPDW